MGRNGGIHGTAEGFSVGRMVESIVGCKWSLSVLDAVRHGVQRPGEMKRAIPGISTKVLNERLAKMVRFGILEKTLYPEVPPRVEYGLTAFGRKFARILDDIEALERELHADSRSDRALPDVPVEN